MRAADGAADVRVPRKLPSRGRLHSAGVIAALVFWGLAGCENKVEVPNIGGDPGHPGPNCDADNNDSVQTALDLILDGTENRHTLCPRYDWDYWRFTVTGNRQLLDVSASYNKSGDIGLAIDLEGPKDACVTGTACSATNPCTDSLQCDNLRGFCRGSAVVSCADAADCESSESCTRADVDSVAMNVLETASTATINRIDTTLPALIPGDYFVRLYDRNNNAEDETTEYVLTVSARQDPDIHEPNNAANMATVLGTADSTTGYFSYRNDVDWYRVDPAFSGTAIIDIDLSWLDGTLAAPTWTIYQGDHQQVPDALPRTVAGGRALGSAYILANNEPIYIAVTNTDAASVDSDSPYTLDVTVFADNDEVEPRDDWVTHARVLTVGGTGGSQEFTQRLIARNDRDWYRVNRTASGNSLLYFNVVANTLPPENAPFLLKAQVYYPTGNACGGGCTSSPGLSRVCVNDLDECMVWFQQPAVLLPGGSPSNWAAEFGGPTPNNLTAQIPFYTDSVYILVQHIAETPLLRPGYSDSVDYTLTVENRLEQDLEDRNNPDNVFLTLPLDNDVTKGTFWDHARQLSSSDFVVTTPGVPATTEFALLTSAAVAELGACTALTFQAYTTDGSPSGSGTATFACPGGSFFTDVGCTIPGASVSLNSTGTVYFQAASVGLTTMNVSLNGDLNIPHDILVYPSGNAAPPAISLDGPTAGFMNSASGVITATIPTSNPVPPIALDVALPLGSSLVMCHTVYSEAGAVCPYIDNQQSAAPAMANPCAQDGSTPICQLPIVSGNSYGMHLLPSSADLVVIRVSDSSGSMAPATWAYAPYGPATYEFNNTSSARGRISYLGDNDFFFLNIPDLAEGHMTATLNYDGNANLRLGIARVANAAGWCGSNCGISVTGSHCTPCEEPGDACNYVTSGGGVLTAWVNEANFDDWDDTAEYSFTFTYQEGCPTACGQYVCGQ